MFTVGAFQENCSLVRPEGAEKALLIDPGDEAERLQAAMSELGVEPAAILLTHTHIDHIGAVGPIARATVSIICSRATVSIIHGARYAPRGQVFVQTARAFKRSCGIRYGPTTTPSSWTRPWVTSV